MKKLLITVDNRGYLARLIEDLVRYGWTFESIPESGKIPRNGLKLILKVNNEEIHVRLFTYKVTTSSRGLPHERRVEITTTYQGGLKRASGYKDVVIGMDTATGKYVGIDAIRLNLGGKTHNASSSLTSKVCQSRRANC